MRKRALLYLSPGPVEDAADHGADDVVEHVLLGVPLVDVARADEQQAFPLAERDGAGVLDNLMEGGKTECEGDDKEEGIVRRKAPAQVEAVEDDGRGEPEVQVDVEIVLHAEEMPLVEVERPRGVEEQEHRKEQVGFFAQKGGHMRDVAKKMREKIKLIEEEEIEERQEDKIIRPFVIPCQEDIAGDIVNLTKVSVMRGHKPITKKVAINLKRRDKLELKGPNGIGKTTLLEMLASGKAKGAEIAEGTRIGFYRQDFSTLNFEETVYQSLIGAIAERSDVTEHSIRSMAAGFLIGPEMMQTRVEHLSEGQKGLLSFARLILQRPGLLILDEPTNHINFRHLPIIAKALQMYGGAMILVSHMPEFIKEIKITQELDLGS